MKIESIQAKYLIDGKVCIELIVPQGSDKAIQRLLDNIGTNYQQYEFDVLKRKSKARSNDANAYLWSIVTQIANKLNADKEYIYFDLLKHYGQSTVVSILSSVDVKGFFKYYEEFGKGEANGKEFTHYKVFKGSSEYNTEEMSILIKGAISEAEELGLEVDLIEWRV